MSKRILSSKIYHLKVSLPVGLGLITLVAMVHLPFTTALMFLALSLIIMILPWQLYEIHQRGNYFVAYNPYFNKEANEIEFLKKEVQGLEMRKLAAGFALIHLTIQDPEWEKPKTLIGLIEEKNYAEIKNILLPATSTMAV
ncbi:hypothetical protein [Persicobacter diffluens]|uniref:Uncharacterized protein n=1 Tax=Persicobacter diffluens TaxID=981 RepID=A0AAN4VVV9_9BACT|nr:hypothetical protein PEDI_04790 [Persicobacter diffluens]